MPINPLSTDWLVGVPLGAGVLPTFGVPPCILNLGMEVLQLLPGDALAGLTAGINKGIVAAQTAAQDVKNTIFDLIGMEDLDGDGTYEWGLDSGLGGIGSFMDEILGVLGAGIGIVQENTTLINSTVDEINAIVACLESFRGQVADSITTDPVSNEETEAYLFEQETILAQCSEFIEKAINLLEMIGSVIIARQNGEIFDPDIDEEEEEEIFRLTFGPPESKSGSFLLSVDGLYYDSQNRVYSDGSEIPTLDDISNLSFVPDTNKWKLDHSPNLGGKGTQVSLGDLDDYIGTIFDIENIDDGQYLLEHYSEDHTLGVLQGNKSKIITDMERDKQNLIASGYDPTSAIIHNMQQGIFSTIESFDIKIRKRKKQIEVAVKAYDLFGYDKTFLPGKVPVNDFSYLSNLNLEVGFQKQKKLVIDHGEVSGIILPVKPIFVKQATTAQTFSLTPLRIAPIGTGAFADLPSASSTVLPALTISDAVAPDHLVAIYSFLNAKVEPPNSVLTNVISCNNDSSQDAQLVGRSTSEVFSQGLGIPLLDGVVSFAASGSLLKPTNVGSYLRLPPSKRMQDLMFNLRGCSFDFWLHMPKAFAESYNRFEQGTFPTATGNSQINEDSKGAWLDYNYYKVILANENTGGSYTGDPDIMPRNGNSDTVRGMVMGFTRDPQMKTQGTTATRGSDTDIALNYAGLDSSSTTSSFAFFIAPTQSIQDSSGNNSVEFIRSGSCESTLTTFDCMIVPHTKQTASGYTFGDLSSTYVHMNVSFDVQNDLISVYLNNELLDTAPMSTTFGTQYKEPPRIPSFISTGDNPSFLYSKDNLNTSATFVLDNGPTLDPFFTPWVIGGGWTDGSPITYSTSSGGFMGSTSIGGSASVLGSHGFSSALGGRVGSFKVYDKPLDISEITTNYNAHKAFFQNIKIQ